MGAHEVASPDRRHATDLDADGAEAGPDAYERLARRWIEKFMDENEPDLGEVTYAAELLRDLEARPRSVSA